MYYFRRINSSFHILILLFFYFLSEWPKDIPGLSMSRRRCFWGFKKIIKGGPSNITATYKNLQLRESTFNFPIPYQSWPHFADYRQPYSKSSGGFVRVEWYHRYRTNYWRRKSHEQLCLHPSSAVQPNRVSVLS